MFYYVKITLNTYNGTLNFIFKILDITKAFNSTQIVSFYLFEKLSILTS